MDLKKGFMTRSVRPITLLIVGLALAVASFLIPVILPNAIFLIVFSFIIGLFDSILDY